jgi:hypothetical protein
MVSQTVLNLPRKIIFTAVNFFSRTTRYFLKNVKAYLWLQKQCLRMLCIEIFRTPKVFLGEAAICAKRMRALLGEAAICAKRMRALPLVNPFSIS